jgi:hypothetical protein
MTSQPNITLSEPLLTAVREEAERQHKGVDELAGELIQKGLLKQAKDPLEELAEYGRQKAIEKFGTLPSDKDIVDLIHARRQERRR